MPMTAQVQNPETPPTQEREKLSPMGNSSSSANPSYHVLLQEEPNNTQEKKSNKLRLIPLIFLIYFEVSGGPFGEEPAVQAAGPLLAILGFLIFPFIWSVPEALITAELSTTFPGNGGYVIWATRAFGPFWGSMMGSWKYLSGAINSAAFPALCADYLKQVFPIFSGGVARYLLLALFNIFLTFLNYTGLTVVGYTSVALGTISLFPFVLMGIFSIPKLHPRHWIELGDKKKDWNGFFNTLFWNLNYWDNASTLAGEVDSPHKTYPKALLFSCLLACIGYLIPLFAATGALEVDQQQWSGGFLAVAAGKIAGNWLKYWVEIGSVLSSIGLFEAQLSSCAYQIEGMAELGFLPRFAGSRSAWFNTPWVGILAAGLISLGLSFVSFDKIIDSANFMYSLGMFLEFASFVWLRKKYPALERPYKVPVGIPGLVCMCLIPSGFLVFILVIAGTTVMLISCGLTVLGIIGYFAMVWLKKKAFLEFNKDEGIVVVEAS